MTTCGVCPTPKCVSRSTLGLPNIDDSGPSSNSSNAGLIGGLVGGLLGAGLIIGALIYLFIRRRNKNKDNLPLAFRSKQRNNNNTAVNEEMQERASRQVMSGVIPVTFIPPTASNHNSMYTESEAETPRSRYGSFATFANHHDDDLENPFSDRPISNAHSIMTTTTTTTDYHGRRDSIESHVSRQQVATVVQATQVMRAKPQIMRVNTVKVEGLSRSGSFKKTIQPENASSSNSTPTSRTTTPLPTASPLLPTAIVTTTTTTPTITEEDDPFDDKNKVTTTSPTAAYTDSVIGPRNNKPTDSVMSAPGDGEITIFWNGS